MSNARSLLLLLCLVTVIFAVSNCKGFGYNRAIDPQFRRGRMINNMYPDFVNAVFDGNNKQKRSGKQMGNSKIKASDIAQKAAKEATAASEAQMSAGRAASQQVKAQLAEKAGQAARAAEAALAGKQQIVEQLSQEIAASEAVLQEATNSLENAQQSIQVSQKAAEQTRRQLKTLTEAVQTAQSNAGNAEQAASGAQAELVQKTQLLEAAKTRLEQLMRQLSLAQDDFRNTKKAAYKAACAAHEAKVNVQKDRRRNLIKRYILSVNDWNYMDPELDDNHLLKNRPHYCECLTSLTSN